MSISKDSTMQMVSLRGSVRVPATVLVSDGIVKKGAPQFSSSDSRSSRLMWGFLQIIADLS